MKDFPNLFADKPTFSQWINQVTGCVHFIPDRKSIEKELTDHFQDHVQALLDSGYDLPLAEERALNAMGDAREIGTALNKIHRPWLGWLWKGTQILVWVLLLTAVLSLVRGQELPSRMIQRTEDQFTWAVPAGSISTEAAHATVYLSPATAEKQPDGTCLVSCSLLIQTDGPEEIPWPLILQNLAVSDSQLPEIPLTDRDPITFEVSPVINYQKIAETGQLDGWTRYTWPLVLVLDHCPEWVAVSWPHGTDRWTLRTEVIGCV